ncbi:PSD1 and planctomycete cytochrome C domain-containing protein [Isosphaeraceae bacterium EP7]
MPPEVSRADRGRSARPFLQIGAFAAVLLARVAAAAEDEASRRSFFESKIRPVLAIHCYDCHGASKQAGGLRVDWKGGLIEGGDSGPSVEPGDADGSLLVRVMEHAEPGLEMPQKAPKLPESALKDLRDWVMSGAYDPRDVAPSPEDSGRQEWEAKLGERRSWWSLQPIARPAVPSTRDARWPEGPVDRFVLAKLERAGLAPSAPADRAPLARRLAFVLTGLPPGEDMIRSFVGDSSPEAYERLVDRLLDSPHFGEHWARHWMDVVRYGDTYGYEWDIPAKGAWRYRDYLVRAFNADIPFDQLTREQIAGDLLERPRLDPAGETNESLIGPMFLQMGENRHGDSAQFDGIHQEMVHNKIDAFSKAFQGTTVGCARCHDHKIDAVSQRDYYALAGAFMSPRWVTHTLDTPARGARALDELRRLKGPLRRALADWWLGESRGWAGELLATPSPSDAPTAWGRATSAAGAEPPWEHPLRAWVALAKVARDKGDLAAAWSSIAAGYAGEHKTRADDNASKFKVVADFSKGLPPGWSVDGVGLRDGPVRPGDFVVALEGPAALVAVLPGGLFTNALSPRLNGALRSPYLKSLPAAWLSLETCGAEFAAERTVVDNAFLTERQEYLARPAPAWSTVPPLPELAGRNVYRELATKTSNPNFPPRVGLGGACTDAQAADPRSWFGVTRAVVGSAQGTPRDDLAQFLPLFEGPAPTTLAEVAARYSRWCRASLERWAGDEATDHDAIRLNWLLTQGMLTNRWDGPAPFGIRDLVNAYRAAERLVPDPQTVNGLADLDDGENYRLNVRGEYDKLGAAVPRGYLGVLAEGRSAPEFSDRRSGRLELAERVASADNPLTARVYANRVWQWVFGTGIVATPDDFGKLGDPPSNPELLDWLAARLVDRGWSTKALVRELVLTATFRQGSIAAPGATEVDPGNRLLHHAPLRRLEAESVRDAILAASGRLDLRLSGPTIDPHRANEDPQKRLVSGPLDGDGRRSLYIKSTLMEPPRFLATFNQPPPKIPAGRRDLTNVPAQALALLNDPFVQGQARLWGERLAAGPPASVDARLTTMFNLAFGRPPRADELGRWAGLVDALARGRGVGPHDVPTCAPVWSDVAHTLFNTKEFLYLR